MLAAQKQAMPGRWSPMDAEGLRSVPGMGASAQVEEFHGFVNGEIFKFDSCINPNGCCPLFFCADRLVFFGGLFAKALLSLF